jgi:hypothetical protein
VRAQMGTLCAARRPVGAATRAAKGWAGRHRGRAASRQPPSCATATSPAAVHTSFLCALPGDRWIADKLPLVTNAFYLDRSSEQCLPIHLSVLLKFETVLMI